MRGLDELVMSQRDIEWVGYVLSCKVIVQLYPFLDSHTLIFFIFIFVKILREILVCPTFRFAFLLIPWIHLG